MKTNNDLKVSVAGIRGEYPAGLTPELALRFGAAFGRYIRERRVYLGRDTRPSGPALSAAVTAGLLAAGKDVVDAGIIPTPVMGFLLERLETGAGVMVTASHNPLPYNGLKFFSPRGTFLTEKEGAEFLKEVDRRGWGYAVRPGVYAAASGYVEKTCAAVYRAIGVDAIRRRHFKVVVDCGGGVGVLWMRGFLSGLGCSVVLAPEAPPGRLKPDPEPTPGNLGALGRAVVRHRADIGLALDPDGDRLAVVSEKGSPIGEELTVALAAELVLARKRGPVVVNLSTTMLVDEIAARYGVPSYRSKVGEVNVVDAMRKTGAVIGGEGNGGVIWPAVHYGRDGFVGAALILDLMARNKTSVSGLTGRYPAFRMYKEKFPAPGARAFARLRKHFAGERPDASDGLKICRADGWIHLRISGTEGVLRVIVEGRNDKIARRYLDEVHFLLNR